MTRILNGNTESTRGQVGQGIYSLADLRLYLAYYGGKQADGEPALHWLSHVLNPVAHRPRHPDYSFSDLISLFVVRELLRLGVRPSRIREAELYMRMRFGTDRPFVSEEVATDGESVFVRSDVPEQVETATQSGGQQVSRVVVTRYLGGQQVSRVVVARYLKNVGYHRGEAVFWSPIDHVWLNPKVQFGEPVVADTRILTSTAAETTERYGASEAVARLAIPVSAARSALRFERRLAALRD